MTTQANEAVRPMSYRPGWPVLGEIVQVWRDPLALVVEGMQSGEAVVGFRFGPYRYVLVNQPEGIEHVLKDNARAYHKSPTYDGLKLVLGHGLVTSEDDLWRRQRKLVQPAFHHRCLVRFADDVVEQTDLLLDRWHAAGARTVDIYEEMTALTFAIVGRTLFSADIADKAGDVGRALEFMLSFARDYAERLVRIPIWLPLPGHLKFKRNLRVVDGVIAQLIEARRDANAPVGDLLDLLLSAADDQGSMSDRQLRDEVMTLALAGHETTALAMTYTWHLLTQHTDVLEGLRAEVAVLDGRPPSYADLARLPLSERIIKESLRLYPPAWGIERIALEDDVVCGHAIPKGTLVGIAPFGLHRDPQYWPRPDRFDPNRFRAERDSERPRFAYVPFGGGPRVCIGNAFAMMEARLALVRMAQRAQVERLPQTMVRLNPGITLRPEGEVLMRVQATSSTTA